MPKQLQNPKYKTLKQVQGNKSRVEPEMNAGQQEKREEYWQGKASNGESDLKFPGMTTRETSEVGLCFYHTPKLLVSIQTQKRIQNLPPTPLTKGFLDVTFKNE